VFIVLGFGDSAITLQFSPWATRENYLELKNSIQIEIKLRFDAEGVEIPFPQRSLHVDPESPPLPVRLVEDGKPLGRRRQS
jgi:small-conductance mechanosensitive channel